MYMLPTDSTPVTFLSSRATSLDVGPITDYLWLLRLPSVYVTSPIYERESFLLIISFFPSSASMFNPLISAASLNGTYIDSYSRLQKVRAITFTLLIFPPADNVFPFSAHST